MKKRPTPIDTVRGGRSELENDLFDELLSGRIGRRGVA